MRHELPAAKTPCSRIGNGPQTRMVAKDQFADNHCPTKYE